MCKRWSKFTYKLGNDKQLSCVTFIWGKIELNTIELCILTTITCLTEALGQWLTAMIHIRFRSLEEWMSLILMERDLKTDCAGIQKTNRHYNCKLNSTPNINLKLKHIFKMVRQRPEIKRKTKKKPSQIVALKHSS